MDSPEELSPMLGPRKPPGNTHQNAKDLPENERLRFHLRKDSFVENVKELRDTDKERDAVLVKRLHDALWRNTRQENYGRSDTQGAKAICNEREHMRERQHRKYPVLLRQLERFGNSANLVCKVV